MKDNEEDQLLNKKIGEIEGMQVMPLVSHADSRGKFTRILDDAWLSSTAGSPKQINLSQNPASGTLRGMHFQIDGEPEHKVITLISGSIYLVVIDLRKTSSTYLNKFTTYVNEESATSFFIPSGCANGWITLSEDTWIHYAMYSRFENNRYSGFKYNEPFFAIDWPCEPVVISDQDLNWPIFQATQDF